MVPTILLFWEDFMRLLIVGFMVFRSSAQVLDPGKIVYFVPVACIEWTFRGFFYQISKVSSISFLYLVFHFQLPLVSMLFHLASKRGLSKAYLTSLILITLGSLCAQLGIESKSLTAPHLNICIWIMCLQCGALFWLNRNVTLSLKIPFWGSQLYLALISWLLSLLHLSFNAQVMQPLQMSSLLSGSSTGCILSGAFVSLMMGYSGYENPIGTNALTTLLVLIFKYVVNEDFPFRLLPFTAGMLLFLVGSVLQSKVKCKLPTLNPLPSWHSEEAVEASSKESPNKKPNLGWVSQLWWLFCNLVLRKTGQSHRSGPPLPLVNKT